MITFKSVLHKVGLALPVMAFAFALGTTPTTYAAVFDLPVDAVTSIGGAAVDTASSVIGMFGDLLPILVPVIVIGFAIGFVSKRIGGARA